MSVKTGTRPGTKPNQKIPGWSYLQASGPEWETIRKNGRETMRFEGEVDRAIADMSQALSALHVAKIMLHGGHVEKGTLALSGVRANWKPSQIFQHVESLHRQIKATL